MSAAFGIVRLLVVPAAPEGLLVEAYLLAGDAAVYHRAEPAVPERKRLGPDLRGSVVGESCVFHLLSLQNMLFPPGPRGFFS